MRYLMGIDNGGTFSKAAIFREDGVQIASKSASVSLFTPDFANAIFQNFGKLMRLL